MQRTILFVILPIILFVLYVSLTSSSTGINGVSVSGCSCHNAAPSANTMVSISGLPAGGYTNGTVYPLTISVTNNVITPFAGGFGLRDGFDLTSSSGSFTAVAGTALNGATEIRHNTPKAAVGGTASWTFNWTAPAAGNDNVTFNLAGNATNGDGNTGGDQWSNTSVIIAKSGIPLTVTATNTNISCNGGVSTITATGIGGKPGYQYKLNAGAYQNGNTFSSQIAGTYTVTIKDALNNTATTALTINQPNAINLSVSSGTILCNAGTTSITATASGGTGSLTYRLNAGAFQASNTFLNQLAGTYTVTARDASLCTKTSTILITQPSIITIGTPLITPITCNNGSDGQINVTAVGGTGTRTFTINPSGPQSNTSGAFTGLGANTYTITVTDAQSCTRTRTAVLTNPAAVNVTATDVIGCSGTPISLLGSPAGGTFSIANPYTGPSTTYTYTYTTGTGCVITSEPAFVESKSITLDPIISSKDVICEGGSVSLQVSLTNQLCFADNFYNGPNSEHITNVNFAGINHSTILDTLGYHDYTSITGNVTAGSSYTISLTDGAYFAGDQWGVWIDYNNDGVFSDFKEYYYFPATGPVTTGNIKIPSGIANGTVRMRVRLIWSTPMQPCGISNWGEVEDYSIQISGGINTSTALSYSWSNNLSSTYSSLNTASTQASNISNSENFMVQVTSPEGCSTTATKTIVTILGIVVDNVTATPSQVCPGGSSLLQATPHVDPNQNCIPGVANMNCTNLEYISGVTIGTINNNTPCDVVDYKDYTSQSTTLAAGVPHSFTLKNGYFYLGDTWAIFIDFNHNGILDDMGEYFLYQPHAPTFTGTLTIPTTAFNGPTRMRVRLNGNSPCGISNWGEIEDYTVVITGATPAQPPISYAWSNNLNSNLIAGNSPTALATAIQANENYQLLSTTVNGCSQLSMVPVIINCGYNFTLKLYIQGYYDVGSHEMLPALFNQGESANSLLTDTVVVELHEASNPSNILLSEQALLYTNGTASCTFSSAPTSSFYVVIKHRNGLETWSDQILSAAQTNYDFSNAVSKTYGSNAVELETGVYGIYSGDVNQDQAIDAFDYILMDPDIVAGNSGYLVTDINGDGAVDAFDYLIVDPNIVNGISISAP